MKYRKPTAIMDLPGGGHLTLEWGASARAERYHVWMKKPSDADFAAVATTYDNDAVLANLPTGVALTFRITAKNAAGECSPSPGISVTLA